ncbi:30S ribosomal protein S4 [Vampirovibrio chlorellavorus]|uniref:30S ribosomal protein S4 n=1 Tax=Vampirovibrio chlorellavorus TaxID=758823 RepID=UPI0026F127B1|nr:30S ribosomal protein S4 [Vampirovibrio chlorellavorus]
MARYRDSIFKQSRRAGTILDISPKAAKMKNSNPPGQHGAARKKLSEYALQLAEKQKVRRIYGLVEKQFRRTYEKAVRRQGVTGTILLQFLESRVDNILYRSGLATTRPQARQLISHGHIEINGHKVDIASYKMKPGDLLAIREKSKALAKNLQAANPHHSPMVPHWLEVDETNMVVKFKSTPEREDLDQTINEALIIEYYSR